MTRFARIVRHEWRLLHTGPLTWVTVVLVSVLGGYAAVNGARWTAAVEGRIEATRLDETTRLRAMRTEVVEIETGRATPARFRDPTKASWVGEFLGTRFARWPLAPLTAWAIGQRDLLPAYLKVGTLSRDAWIFEEEIENPLHLAVGRFDLAYVIIVVLPLIVLTLGFDLLSAEREAGTLRLLLAQPVRLRTVVAAKVLVRLAWAGVLVLLVLAAGVLFATPEVSLSMSWRVALWAVTAFVYLTIWMGIATLANLSASGSAANAVRLTAIWMAFVVVAPAALSLLATARHPPPARIEVHERDRELRRDLASRSAEILEAHYRAHPDQRPSTVDKTDWAPGFYATQIARDEALDALYAAHDAQVAAQQAFVDRWRWISPALVAQGAFHDLAGTGTREAQRFLSQVLGYHETWQAFFYPRLFARQPMTANDYDQLPAFVFEAEADRQIAARVLRRFATLLTTGIATLLAVRWRLARGAGGA